MLTEATVGDVHKATASIKSHLPGTGSDPNAAKKLENIGSEAGAKLDKAVSSLSPRTPWLREAGEAASNERHRLTPQQWNQADSQVAAARNNAQAYAKDAKSEALKAVDKFDKTVEEGAAKAKSGISGWFGGSK